MKVALTILALTLALSADCQDVGYNTIGEDTVSTVNVPPCEYTSNDPPLDVQAIWDDIQDTSTDTAKEPEQKKYDYNSKDYRRNKYGYFEFVTKTNRNRFDWPKLTN